MSGTALNEVRRGFYLDSVALMRFSRTIAAMAGIEEAALMMGTPSNRRVMADAGLLGADGEAANGGDLIIGPSTARSRSNRTTPLPTTTAASP